MHISRNQIKYINSLGQKKYRQREGKFIVEGYKLVEEAFNASNSIDAIVYTKKASERTQTKKLFEKLYKSNVNLLWASKQEMDKFSNFKNPDGVLAVINIEKKTKQIKGNLIVVLDGVNDPGNLGTIIRTCDWFGVETLILGPDTVDPYNPKVVRATMGSIFRLEIIQSNDLAEDLERLKKDKYVLIGTDLATKNYINDFGEKNQAKKLALVFGSESQGLKEDIMQLCDKSVKIKGYGKSESLNIAVSVGIILQEMKKDN